MGARSLSGTDNDVVTPVNVHVNVADEY